MRCSPGSMKLLTSEISSARSVKDVDWIGRLSDEGHWIVISGDANIAKRKAEQSAFRNSRLTGVLLRPRDELRQGHKADAASPCDMG